MKRLSYTVRRGAESGVILFPHRYRDGAFRVSMTRFEKDQIVVREEAELIRYIREGFGIRMSNPKSNYHHAPSLINPGHILINDN